MLLPHPQSQAGYGIQDFPYLSTSSMDLQQGMYQDRLQPGLDPEWHGGSNKGTGPRVFCGHVPKEVNEDLVRAHFSAWGPVTDVYFPRHKKTLKRRPFCFVSFVSLESAERAVAESPLAICGVPIKSLTMVEDRNKYYQDKHWMAQAALVRALRAGDGIAAAAAAAAAARAPPVHDQALLAAAAAYITPQAAYGGGAQQTGYGAAPRAASLGHASRPSQGSLRHASGSQGGLNEGWLGGLGHHHATYGAPQGAYAQQQGAYAPPPPPPPPPPADAPLSADALAAALGLPDDVLAAALAAQGGTDSNVLASTLAELLQQVQASGAQQQATASPALASPLSAARDRSSGSLHLDLAQLDLSESLQGRNLEGGSTHSSSSHLASQRSFSEQLQSPPPAGGEPGMPPGRPASAGLPPQRSGSGGPPPQRTCSDQLLGGASPAHAAGAGASLGLPPAGPFASPYCFAPGAGGVLGGSALSTYGASGGPYDSSSGFGYGLGTLSCLPSLQLEGSASLRSQPSSQLSSRTSLGLSLQTSGPSGTLPHHLSQHGSPQLQR